MKSGAGTIFAIQKTGLRSRLCRTGYVVLLPSWYCYCLCFWVVFDGGWVPFSSTTAICNKSNASAASSAVNADFLIKSDAVYLCLTNSSVKVDCLAQCGQSKTYIPVERRYTTLRGGGSVSVRISGNSFGCSLSGGNFDCIVRMQKIAPGMVPRRNSKRFSIKRDFPCEIKAEWLRSARGLLHSFDSPSPLVYILSM